MKRHLFQTITAILFILMTFATTQASNKSSCYNDVNQPSRMADRQLRGDVNGDGERTIVDVTILVNYILTHQADFEIWTGDLDNDNEITVVDITILVNIILGGNYVDPDNPDLPLDDLEGDDPANGL